MIVHLSNERLRNLTIIDTPGLNTVTEANEAVTSDLLGLDDDSQSGADSRVAMTEADALVFLMPHVRAHDASVLGQFRNLFDGTGLSAVNVVGVLSKIDKLTPDGDPWPTARRLAARARQELGSVVCDVIPVNGLLAETALTDRYHEEDTHVLRQLSQMDDLDLEDQLLTQSDFLAADEPAGISPDQRSRLLSMLDLHGVTITTEALRDGAEGTRQLLELLLDSSGIEPLSQLVSELFTRRADALKAHAGLAALRRLTVTRADTPAGPGDAGQGPDPDQLRAVHAALERIELAPELYDLRLFEGLRRLDDGEIKVPDELASDLRRLALESSPAERVGLAAGSSPSHVREAAKECAKKWARWGNDPRRGPREERFADDVRGAYELMFHQASEEPR